MFEAFDVTGLTIGTFNSVREFIENFVYTELDHENYLVDMEMECEREGDEEFSPDNYPYEDGVDFYYECIRQDGVTVLTPDGIPAIEWDGMTLVGIDEVPEREVR
jgi:hypothetical protein